MTTSDKTNSSQIVDHVRANTPLSKFAAARPGVLGGKLCFKDARLSIAMFFDYLCTGKGAKDFIREHGGVTLDEAEGVILLAFEALLRENGLDEDLHRQVF